MTMAFFNHTRVLLPALRARTPGRRAFGIYDDFNLLSGVADKLNRVVITGYDDEGFELNKHINHEGSLICFNGLTFSWTPKKFSDITPESLTLFELLRPAPAILVIGCGRRIEHVGKDLRDFLRSNGMKIEAVDTRNAASTFNFLNEEGRSVAAALLPYGLS